MSLADYKLDRKIGQGGYGEVFLYTKISDRKQYVIKMMSVTDADLRKAAETEVKLLRDLRHPNVASYRDSFITKDSKVIYLVMEYCDGGDLADRIKQFRTANTQLKEEEIVEWTLDLCRALQYIHARNIMHRDLKPQNIFLTQQNVVKIGDFGIARQLKPGDLATTAVGTPLYISPEVLHGCPYDSKVDMWSLGCCVYEMMTLKPAVSASLLLLFNLQVIGHMPTDYSAELTQLTASMLTIDPSKRLTASQLLDSDILKAAQSKRAASQVETCFTAVVLPITPASRPPTPAPRRIPSASPPTPAALSLDVPPPPKPKPRSGDKPPVARRQALSPPPSMVIPPIHPTSSTTAAVDNSHLFVTKLRPRRGSLTEAQQDLVQAKKELKSLRFTINAKSELVDIDNGASYVYNISKNKDKNEKRYQEIAHILTKYVQALLITELNMHKQYIPIDGKPGEAKTFIYTSDDFETNNNVLMMLIQGNGAPRAGEWARKVMMNQSLNDGSQMLWIKRAMKKGYAVVVLNPNENTELIAGRPVPVRGNSTSSEHVEYVWDDIISTSPAHRIVIVAHSHGGVNTIELALSRTKGFTSRVAAIAFADSMHVIDDKVPEKVIKFLRKHARNWVCNSQPVDTEISTPDNEIQKVSAGETRHEWTTPASFHSVFQFINQKLK